MHKAQFTGRTGRRPIFLWIGASMLCGRARCDSRRSASSDLRRVDTGGALHGQMCVTFPTHPVAFGVPSHGSHFTPVMLSHVNTPRHPPSTHIDRLKKQLKVRPKTHSEPDNCWSRVTEHQCWDSPTRLGAYWRCSALCSIDPLQSVSQPLQNRSAHEDSERLRVHACFGDGS